jgi:hypothetical protein
LLSGFNRRFAGFSKALFQALFFNLGCGKLSCIGKQIAEIHGFGRCADCRPNSPTAKASHARFNSLPKARFWVGIKWAAYAFFTRDFGTVFCRFHSDICSTFRL